MKTETVMMPRSLTAENGAKKLMIGEFSVEIERECEFCDGDGWENESRGEECRYCEGKGHRIEHIPVPWTTIKEIYAKAVKHLGT